MDAWFVFAVTSTDTVQSDDWSGTFPAESTVRAIATNVSIEKPGTLGVVFASNGAEDRTLIAVNEGGS